MALVTFALRASFLLLPPGVETPPLAAARAALRAGGGADRDLGAGTGAAKGSPIPVPAKRTLLAGVVAIAVAWRWRMTFATIVAGLLALHFFDWLI